jgi:Domain of unknown function (DUF4933)
MKRLIIPSFFGLMLLFNLSCHNNRLKTNEKELSNEIILQENEKKIAEKSAIDKKMSETDIKSSGGLRVKEIRSVDPHNLPIRIDIPGTDNNVRKLKLSDVASSVRYVKLQTPPDSSLLYDNFYYRDDLMSTIRSDGKEIIFQGLFGLTRFNLQGEYLETIWKNQTGIKIFGSSYVTYAGKDFYGIPPSVPININNGNIYFDFLDGPTGNGQIMKYKSGTNKILSGQSQPDIPGLGKIPGDTLFNTNKNWQERFAWIYGTSAGTWAGINNKWNAGTSGTLLVTYNNKGDTLCQFTDFDRIKNFNYANGNRNAVELASYFYNNLLTIKQEYNDTVFRVMLPNTLLPVYIIDFGLYKFNYIDGFNPNFDLSGKLMLNSLNETNDFLFIRYTQNSDCVLNRKKNAVKFYNALFNKKDRKIYINPGFAFLPKGIVNDIDGGMPFWPDFITPNGEMMKLVSGKVMKDYVKSAEFKEANISKDNRQKQNSMVTGLKNTDMVIMIVK